MLGSLFTVEFLGVLVDKGGKSWIEGSGRDLCQGKAHCNTHIKIKVISSTYIVGIKKDILSTLLF